MTDQITITSADAITINAERLGEELAAALGVPVTVYARHERGVLREGIIRRADGQPFPPEEVATVRAVVAAHDPARLTDAQTAERDRRLARQAAYDRLSKADLAALQNAIGSAETITALRDGITQLAGLVSDLRAIIAPPG
ncbi:MAG TPA: hypothetical protein ENI95_10995 [Chloroflexi bacterium]|nr:hypothetical protein [Chloroflexota bacterium]